MMDEQAESAAETLTRPLADRPGQYELGPGMVLHDHPAEESIDEADVDGMLPLSVDTSFAEHAAVGTGPDDAPRASGSISMSDDETVPVAMHDGVSEPSGRSARAPSSISSSPPSSSNHDTFDTEVTTPSPTSRIIALSPPSTPSTPTSQAPRSSTPNLGASGPDATPRYSIPNRRPAGWISSLAGPRVLSNVSNRPERERDAFEDGVGSGLDTVRAASGVLGKGKGIAKPRVTSVHAQTHPRSGARRVSGAMQYAIAPPPLLATTRTASRSSSTDGFLDNEFDLAHAGAAPGPFPLDHAADGQEGEEEGREEEEERIRFEVSTQQEEDEVWMAYVRQQLGVLFPDFFNADPGELARGTGASVDAYDDGEEGDTSSHSLVERVFSSTSDRETSFASFTGTSESSALATPPPTGLPRLASSGLQAAGMGVPNVRDEISGLREEIMRLRSVVGGLAEEMRGDAVGVARDDAEASDSADVRDGAVVEESTARGKVELAIVSAVEENEKVEEISEAFIKTAPTSISIIRLLDQLSQSHSQSSISDPPKAKPDTALFEQDNLEAIMAFVKHMSGEAGTGA